MRQELSTNNEVYLITVEGTPTENIFENDIDKARILLPMLFFQSPNVINNTNWYINAFLRKEDFRIGKNTIENIVKDRYVKLMAFDINNNICKLIVQSIGDMSISVYMQRILTSYSKYYNASRKRFGHVFKGPYKIEHIDDKDEFINHVKEINSNKSKWSSFKDYKIKNRWENILYTDLINGLKK